jgi:hypothetical protein
MTVQESFRPQSKNFVQFRLDGLAVYERFAIASAPSHVVTRDRVGKVRKFVPTEKHRLFAEFFPPKVRPLSLLKFSAFSWGRTDLPRIWDEPKSQCQSFVPLERILTPKRTHLSLITTWTLRKKNYDDSTETREIKWVQFGNLS